MSDEPENFTLALLRKLDGKVNNLRDARGDGDEERHCRCPLGD